MDYKLKWLKAYIFGHLDAEIITGVTLTLTYISWARGRTQSCFSTTADADVRIR
jgi:hypothetical protein